MAATMVFLASGGFYFPHLAIAEIAIPEAGWQVVQKRRSLKGAENKQLTSVRIETVKTQSSVRRQWKPVRRNETRNVIKATMSPRPEFSFAAADFPVMTGTTLPVKTPNQFTIRELTKTTMKACSAKTTMTRARPQRVQVAVVQVIEREASEQDAELPQIQEQIDEIIQVQEYTAREIREIKEALVALVAQGAVRSPTVPFGQPLGESQDTT